MAIIIGTDPAGEILNGTAEDDVIIGFSGPDTLNGGDGVDLLLGGDGNDTLNGGEGTDSLLGEAGNDMLHGGAADDLLDGGLENDTLFGDAGNDSLIGDAGNDTLVGGAGNDTLNGGLGADVFKYSFDTQGGGDTFFFTEFFAAHGGSVVNGEVADGTSQGQFSSLYTQWLEMLIEEQGLGTAVLDLSQNAGADGMPVIENMTGEFGERDSFTWASGSAKKPVVHERWYSDTWTSGGGGGESVSSGDGFDNIVNFDFAEDKLDFDGLGDLTFLEFTRLFKVTVVDADEDGATDDTQLALLDDSWGVSLLDDDGVHGLNDFHDNIFA